MSSIKSLIVLSIIFSVILISETLVCPDSSLCNDGMTCCKWSSGRYGCCPLDSAICCADGLHCCPNGTKCNDKEGTCDQIKVEPKEKIIKSNKTPDNIVCPGGEYQCPDGNTCCKMTGDVWGCCPLESAVCCADKIHCCPSGSTCDPSGCRMN